MTRYGFPGSSSSSLTSPPGAALALAEDLRALADAGLIEIAVDDDGELRCAPVDVDDALDGLDEDDGD